MENDVSHPNYSLTKSREEGYYEEDFVNTLPRAVMRSNSFVLLDGVWKFEHDPDNRGLHERWCVAHEYKDTAHWPGSVESHIANIKPTEALWYDQVIAWYEREFPLPQQDDLQRTSNSLLQLTFGACGYETGYG